MWASFSCEGGARAAQAVEVRRRTPERPVRPGPRLHADQRRLVLGLGGNLLGQMLLDGGECSLLLEVGLLLQPLDTVLDRVPLPPQVLPLGSQVQHLALARLDPGAQVLDGVRGLLLLGDGLLHLLEHCRGPLQLPVHLTQDLEPRLHLALPPVRRRRRLPLPLYVVLELPERPLQLLGARDDLVAQVLHVRPPGHHLELPGGRPVERARGRWAAAA